MMETLSIKDVSEFVSAMKLEDYQLIPNFHILKFSDHFDRMPTNVSLYSSGYFEITFVTHSSSGNAKLKVEDTEFKPLENNFTFVAPGQNTYVEVQGDSSDGDGYMLVFTADFLGAVYSDFKLISEVPFFNTQISPVYNVAHERSDLFLNIIVSLYERYKDGGAANAELLQAYLKVLLLEIKRLAQHYEMPVLNRYAEITYAFENLIKKTALKHRPIGYYASELNISTVYLSECIKKATGKTGKFIIDQYLIMEAKSLLNYSGLNVSEIAARLGFDDRSNFINFFKKKTGITPRLFGRV